MELSANAVNKNLWCVILEMPIQMIWCFNTLLADMLVPIVLVIALNFLTLKHRETHGCVISTVATDALVLKHQAISIHNAE